jgi:NADPH:quinone reductase-like Zn-dependent oxidoreductase
MKALRIHGYGEIADIHLEDIPALEIDEDEVLIRVLASSLNPLDVKLLRGDRKTVFPLTFPYALGNDVAGVIESVGTKVARLRRGDRVFARTDTVRGGAFSNFVAIGESQCATIPAGVSYEDAASLPTAAGTAWQALHEVAKLAATQRLLVHAGAGGVGSFAVQMGKRAGAHVVATASRAKASLVRELGADLVIDYEAERFEDCVRNVDVVLDTVGGEVQRRSFSTMRRGGALVAITSPPDAELAASVGVTATRLAHTPTAARLERIARLVEARELRVVEDRTFPFEAWREAFARCASGRATGKIRLVHSASGT